ncbi:dihydrodipicolinate synthase family protein [Adhaeretor mobilis]|uniref:4-hydroxy-tetrahydrodipicolinate synthase n=1 Tax=Adhaeretor mobilis TaxID=1930276 RepID=A0A517MW39_9BACT|nr:dihydrodipicolinate synthase family protein [Adhaeretor mobilis]QDS99100.1 4-hydroxy-tetrahydrodipicolinate synthase [Adhaeretor mobilis]
MEECYLTAAVGTPLTSRERIDHSGLSLQFDRLWSGGVDCAFIAGTMGCGQLLADETYDELVEQSVQISCGKGALIVGANDMSLLRTQHRIDRLNRFSLGGVVVLPPFFMQFSQGELIDYYQALANESRSPIFLYDIPQRTHVRIEACTVIALAEHPNIAGIKCSGDLQEALQLHHRLALAGIDFPVIMAQADSLYELSASGITQHLDGIYALAPAWARQIVQNAGTGHHEEAKRLQGELTALLKAMRMHGGLSALTVLMNAIGVRGTFAPRPFRQLSTTQQKDLLDEPVVQRFLSSETTSKRNGRSDAVKSHVLDNGHCSQRHGKPSRAVTHEGEALRGPSLNPINSESSGGMK